ncbi:hypothetical protein VUN82_03050 [Micrococcaceae bacterium Sec5.1]
MTYRDMEREDIVDELLLDAEPTDVPGLRQALLSLRSFADRPAPAPSEALAAMFAGPHDELSKRRWRHKHRTAVVSVAVVAAMGLGVSGVAAASSGFTRTPTFVDELLGNFAPQPSSAAPALPTPDAPKVSTEPAPSVDPAAVPLVTESPAAQGGQDDEASGTAMPHVKAPAPQSAPEAEAADVGNVPASGAVGEPPRTDQAKPAEPREAKLEAKLGQSGLEPTLPDVVKPTAEPTTTAKPAPAHGNKPSQALPLLNEKPAHDPFQSFMDKLKQWLRSEGH